MKVLVIDGQGGSIGKEVISRIKAELPSAEVTAVGTNSIATECMLKARPDHAATGENPVVVNVSNTDIIVGPIGIVVANSMFGEVTARMALAIGKSSAKKFLIPINHCNNIVVGVSDLSIKVLLDSLVKEIKEAE